MNIVRKRKTLKKIFLRKKVVCLTAYTTPIASLVDEFADIILVGDSVGPVLYGLKSTREVNLDMIISHAKAVVNNTKNAFIVVDMPFGTYEKSRKDALKNAQKIISSTGAMAVKVEGGEKIFETIKFLTNNKIKVMGHLGMLPQSLKGKPVVYGKSLKEKKQILRDVSLLKKAGVFSIVIECTLKSLVDDLIKSTDLPLIGIGASSKCKGQILVTEDILGMTKFNSKFLKQYYNFLKDARKAVKKYTLDVRKKKYPKKSQCY